MMSERKRSAHFVIGPYSPELRNAIEWRIDVDEHGFVAVRTLDRRRVRISWHEAIGIAMFYGRDTKGETK